MEVLPSKSCKSGNADDKDDADVDVDVEKVCYYLTKLSYQPISENAPCNQIIWITLASVVPQEPFPNHFEICSNK